MYINILAQIVLILLLVFTPTNSSSIFIIKIVCFFILFTIDIFEILPQLIYNSNYYNPNYNPNYYNQYYLPPIFHPAYYDYSNSYPTRVAQVAQVATSPPACNLPTQKITSAPTCNLPAQSSPTSR